MASLNQVQLIGYLGKDPEVRRGEGYLFANLSLATDESYRDRDGNKVKKTEWHRVTLSDKLAETCSQYLHKGSLIYVEGKIATRKYNDDDGYERYVTEIRAFRIQFLDRKNDKNDRQNSQQKAASSEEDDLGPPFPPLDQIPF